MSPSPTPLQSLVRLRLLRFALSIDDFGTGHSSLAQLRDVPFTELKIDRGFVQGARHNQIIRPMLEGSLGIAQRLGMQTVAEGVETEDDWHLLRELGCDYAQGYFIAKPMASDRVPAWLSDWNARYVGLAPVPRMARPPDGSGVIPTCRTAACIQVRVPGTGATAGPPRTAQCSLPPGHRSGRCERLTTR
jgi:predicted signal transduction protein with EAL and GGDEF domain